MSSFIIRCTHCVSAAVYLFVCTIYVELVAPIPIPRVLPRKRQRRRRCSLANTRIPATAIETNEPDQLVSFCASRVDYSAFILCRSSLGLGCRKTPMRARARLAPGQPVIGILYPPTLYTLDVSIFYMFVANICICIYINCCIMLHCTIYGQ